jgi:hypothetical protein
MKKFRDTDYFITENGEVFSKISNKYLKPAKDKKGYLRCAFNYNGKLTTFKVHRLVAEVFIPNLENKSQVNHINGIKSDNRIENLEWVTNFENIMHAIDRGLFNPYDKPKEKSINIETKKGELNGMSKLTESDVLSIRGKFLPRKYTRKQLSKEFDVTENCIKDIVLRKSWKHI